MADPGDMSTSVEGTTPAIAAVSSRQLSLSLPDHFDSNLKDEKKQLFCTYILQTCTNYVAKSSLKSLSAAMQNAASNSV